MLCFVWVIFNCKAKHFSKLIERVKLNPIRGALPNPSNSLQGITCNIAFALHPVTKLFGFVGLFLVVWLQEQAVWFLLFDDLVDDSFLDCLGFILFSNNSQSTAADSFRYKFAILFLFSEALCALFAA